MRLPLGGERGAARGVGWRQEYRRSLGSFLAGIGLLASTVCAPHSADAEPTLPSVLLPPGETPLRDLGTFRVGWQSYGRELNWMPPSWVGDFEEATGIAFQPAELVLGTEALFIHSPWRVAPGRTWVDYPLTLPQRGPIRLTYGIAMGPDTVAPDKGDGVTFSCAVIADGTDHELMKQHYSKTEWKEFTLDLSEYAGKEVTLRLQVEPGPKNNPSFDFSYFGNARLMVGEQDDSNGGTDRALRRFTDTRAYRATENASRLALRNASNGGIEPSNLLPHTNSLTRSGNNWRFLYEGMDARIIYTYKPLTGTLADLSVQVDDRPSFQPALGGGLAIADAGPDNAGYLDAHGGKALEASQDGNTLSVRWEYEIRGKPLRVEWQFQIQAKALRIAVRCDDPIISRFSLGGVGPVPFRRNFSVPYLPGNLVFLPDQQVFAFRQIDWTRSNASRSPLGVAVYSAKTDGTRNALEETGYVAVSSDLGEVLPNIPNPPSPYVKLLGSLVILDRWRHREGTFEGDAKGLRELKDHGVDHLGIIQHDWQRWGYDVKLPDHLPANPDFGGEPGLQAFGKAAAECGFLWALHENYIDLYPDAPSYDPSARVLLTNGSPSPAWYNPGTKVQSWGLKSDRAMDFARMNSPEAHRSYATTAAYLDVHTCVAPWHQLDHDALRPGAAVARAKIEREVALFQFERGTHQGPLLGEGADHFYWAGYCDGVEAQVRGGEDHAPLLDFDLLKLHPQMVNHGMGYLHRWFRGGYGVRYGVDAGSTEQLDKYRAMEVAYGHAGFIDNLLVNSVPAIVREHHILHAVQRLYAASQPGEIRYEVGGSFVTASAALVAGDLTRPRIRYESGLTVWVNGRSEPWKVGLEVLEGSEVHSREHVLPQWGFLAIGPGTEVRTSLLGGILGDYAECPEYVFVDARTHLDQSYLSRGVPASIDFAANTNPVGTWVDFGAVATDGAVKIERGPGRLTIFPYPRDTIFRVELDLGKFVPAESVPGIDVRVLAADTQEDVGAADFKVVGRRLELPVGRAGAGRYVVTWK